MEDPRFEAILCAHGPALRRLVHAWERNAAAREDLWQEILFALWRALLGFRGECAERAFVFRVAHNRALTHRFKPRPDEESLDAAAETRDPRPSPEHDAVAAQNRQRLMHALQALPVAARQILTLSLEGFSRAEIAEVLGITENNTGVRISRARRLLQEQLGDGR